MPPLISHKRVADPDFVRTWLRRFLAFAAFATLVLTAWLSSWMASAASRELTAPPELGKVEWLRDYPTAQLASNEREKPIFLLFQEVPGCRTCVSFGQAVLSHPLIVEAIEDEFVPVAIYNNASGTDLETLRRFHEPAWNNPVVRFTDASGADLVPRRDGIWKPAQVVERMITALDAADRPIPDYLQALHAEMTAVRIERATFSMHCFWEGEACLGAMPGLLSSRTGHLDGREVVEVRFDADLANYSQLLKNAKALGCSDGVFAHDDEQFELARDVFGNAVHRTSRPAREASSRDQKFHLKRRSMIDLERLTPAQATRLNHVAGAMPSSKATGVALPLPAMSPRQKAALSY